MHEILHSPPEKTIHSNHWTEASSCGNTYLDENWPPNELLCLVRPVDIPNLDVSILASRNQGGVVQPHEASHLALVMAVP